MGNSIVIESQYLNQNDSEVISLEQWRIKRERRRKRVAKRMAKRFPLFAVEFMKEEFKDYTEEQFIKDIEKAKLPKKKKGKSQLKRQGRYPLMQKAISNYHLTKDPAYLHEAQQWRKKLFLDFEVVYRLGSETRSYTFPSTTSVRLIKELGQIKWKTWEELDSILEQKLRWIHVF
jgi:hypothetical protein